MGDLVPSRHELVKQGTKGVAGVAGGAGLLILSGISSAGLLPGLIAGGILAVAGFIIGSNREDRKAGLVAIIAGAATAVASLPFIGPLVHWLLPVAGVGLLAAGGWSLFKFWRNMRRRG